MYPILLLRQLQTVCIILQTQTTSFNLSSCVTVTTSVLIISTTILPSRVRVLGYLVTVSDMHRASKVYDVLQK